MQAVGLIAQWVIAPELPWFGYAGGVWLAAALVVICAIPGGMLSVTWTQIAQGVLILIGFVVPAVWISTVGTGMPLPSLALSEPMGVIANLDAALGTAETHGAVLRGWAVGETGPVSILALLACVMIGTASLPQLLVRGMTTPTVRGARLSMGWSLVFVTAVVLTIPAYALFAKAGLLGLFASDGVLAYDAIPGWMLHWSGVGGDLLTICGAPVGDAVTAQGLCGPERAGGITYGDLVFRSEFLVLALPELAAMPVAILVLLVAGGFAAALSSATGLAQTLANSLGHDVVRGMMAPEMGPRQRVTTIKALVVAIVLIAGNIALVPPSDLAVMLAWALSLAGAGLFAALALGIWDRRTTGAGAAAGMVIGFGLTLLYIVVATFGPDLVRDTGDEASWFGIGSEAAGAFGIPAALVTTWLVSRLTPAPDDEIEDFIEDMRIPRDHAIAPTR
jgi:cation/acetate symporter